MGRFRERLALLAVITFSLGFVVFGISSYREWRKGDAGYLTEVVFAVLFLGIAAANLWQWQRLRRLRPQ